MRGALPANPLLKALAAGDERAFATLYDRLGAAMLRVAWALLGAQEAQDAVQDVFVSLVKSRERLLLVEDLEAYIFASLRHVVGRRLKRSKTERQQLAQLASNMPVT